MKQYLKRIIALVLVAVIVLPVTNHRTASAEAAATAGQTSAVPSPVSHYNYYTDVYPVLKGTKPVFKTVTYEDLVKVLDTQGTYAILFGGPSVASTQANIGIINQVAQEKGITTIYNFDTKLDGSSLDIADSTNIFSSVYTDLVSKYLTTGGTSEASDVKDQTFLFVYNKDNKSGTESKPIVASLKTSEAVNAATADSFKNQVKTVLGSANTYDVIDNYDFIAPAFNANVKHNSPNVPIDIFDGTDKNLVFEHVTYPVLKQLLASKGNYVILFGGSWCPNTQAAIKFINEYAKKYNVDKIYFWDPRLDAGVDVTKPTADTHDNERLMIRDTKSKYSYLYVDLVNQYLTNISTQYAPGSNNVNYTKPDGTNVVANKLQVPYLFTYNKDNKDADGNSAPITGHIELMYSWTNIQQGYVNNGVAIKNYETYTTALDKLYSRLESVPTGLTGIAPTTAAKNNGLIVGAKYKTLEYKKDSDTAYTPVSGDAIAGLTPGTYQVRYASKTGYQGPVSAKVNGVTTYNIFTEVPYKAGQSVDVIVPEPAAGNKAPQGLKGIAPTTPNGNDGKITGSTDAQEYKAEKSIEYISAQAPSITGLVYGNYEVRYKAVGNTPVSVSTAVYVPRYGEQAPPAGLEGVAPTSEQSKDGQIVGLTEGLEYKRAAENDSSYRKIDKDAQALTGLDTVAYSLRYAAVGTLSAGPAVEVIVPTKQSQSAPAGLTGKAPTSAANNDGQIIGSAPGQEYRLDGTSAYIPVTTTSVTGLVYGTYQVRYAANSVFYASPDTEVLVPAYVPTYVPPSGPSTSPTPSPTPAPGSETTIGNTVVSSVNVTAKTDQAGTATATVTAEAVNGLIDSVKKTEAAGKSAVVEFKIETGASAKAAELTIPRSAFNSLASGTQAEVKISYAGIGTLAISAKAIDSIGAATGTGDIHVQIAKAELTDEGKQALGDRPVYDFTVSAGDQEVTTFGGGNIRISLPYALKAGETANAVVVYYVNDSGSLETLRGKFSVTTGTVDFSTTHFSQYIIGYNKVQFNDVNAGSWYADAVDFLAARSITTGTDDTHYSPNASVTRGQFIVLLLKAYGVAPEAGSADNFADAGKAYYSDYLAAAKRLGIATGAGDNKFAPDRSISRQELFTLLYRALGVWGELPADKKTGTVGSFSDAAKIADYAKPAFNALVESGVITGSNGKLAPGAASTRAEVAQVLYNLLSQ